MKVVVQRLKIVFLAVSLTLTIHIVTYSPSFELLQFKFLEGTLWNNITHILLILVSVKYLNTFINQIPFPTDK